MKKMNKLLLFSFSLISIQFMFGLSSCSTQNKPEEKPALSLKEMTERGKYLTTIGSCGDCHTPKIMTPEGPVFDTTRTLSGSPSDLKLPAIDETEITPGKWYLGASDLTAWIGPWGISYSANLTPDSATGTGTWTEELFIKILRSGKFMGVDAGRPIMPPMPWQTIRMMTDEDLKCVFAYLQSLPPIKNSVHAYVPPNELKSIN
jgi:hypothetical protein